MLGLCDTSPMGNDHWPLFDLEIRTPRLTLRYLDDELARQVLDVAKQGVHDPAAMPFSIPWTASVAGNGAGSDVILRRTRAEVRPPAWNLQFAVIVEGSVIGACDLGASDFAVLRQFTTGSWLGQRVPWERFRQGAATGSAHARLRRPRGRIRPHRDVARQRALARGHPITRLRPDRSLPTARRGVPDQQLEFRMPLAHWETIRRDDIVMSGIDATRGVLDL